MNTPASFIVRKGLKNPSYRTLFPSPLLRFYTSGEKKFRRISLDIEIVAQARRELRRFAKRLSISDLCSLCRALKKGELTECVRDDSFVGTIIKYRKRRQRTDRLNPDDYNHLEESRALVYWFKQHVGRLPPDSDDYVATTICWLEQIIKERRSGN